MIEAYVMEEIKRRFFCSFPNQKLVRTQTADGFRAYFWGLEIKTIMIGPDKWFHPLSLQKQMISNWTLFPIWNEKSSLKIARSAG